MQYQFPGGPYDLEDSVRHMARRRRELARRPLGSGIVALAWLLLVVVPYRLVRALGRLLVNALSQRPGRKASPAGEDVAAQIKDQQARRTGRR